MYYEQEIRANEQLLRRGLVEKQREIYRTAMNKRLGTNC